MYQLTDLFSLFHIRFVANGNGQDEQFWSKLSGKGQMTSWSGYAFEQVCLHHLNQIKKALSIGGVISNAHSWSCKPFTDKDGIKYIIDADYEEKLRNRISLFRLLTKTRKSIQHTFITTYGVANNLHSGIVQSEVTMDDLFV